MNGLFCFLVLAVIGCSAAWAESIELPRASGTVSIDGTIDEDAWDSAVQVALAYETDPGENLPAHVQTVAYLFEDGESLYVAFEALDPEPTAIRAYLRDRDSAYDDDFVGITIDTYNDGRLAFEFLANALGVQMDLTNNEVGGGENDSWDAIWDSAGQINASGYVVEMRIPLNQLRFPSVDGRKTWGIDLIRRYPRNKRYRFSNNRTDRGVSCYLCQIGEMQGLEGVEPGRDLELVPTLTASQSSSTDEPGVVPRTSGSIEAEGGLSVRWGITPDLTANLAINPDFSQIEADAAQLDVNNRFALFFPEKRPFFLESAGYFNTPIGAVFTRTVASPDVGAKLTGKRGENTFGLIVAQDEITNLLIPEPFGSDTTTLQQSNSAFIGRYSRGFGDTSSFGALLTLRDGDDYHNYVGGLDGRWKIDDHHTVTFQHVESKTRYPGDVVTAFSQPATEFDGRASVARYEFDSRNWFANLRYTRLSDGYRSDLGFLRRSGVNRQTANLGRVWHGRDSSWWDRIRWVSEYTILHLDDGTFGERRVTTRLGIGGPLQSWTQIMLRTGAERDDGVVYNKNAIGVYSEFRPRGGLSFQLFALSGDEIDFSNNRLADQLLIEPSVNWNINRNLLLRFRSVFANLETTQGEKIFDARVADTRLTWQFNVRSFLRFTWQSANTSRNPSFYVDDVDAQSRSDGRQLLYSYKINPQSVFFLGYSDQFVDDDDLDGLTNSDASYFMKIGYAWSL